MAQKFDSVVAGALDVAVTKALQNKNTELVPLHLFYGLLKNPAALAAKSFASSLKEVERLLQGLPQVTGKIDEPRPSPEFNQWITYASSHAIENGHDEVREGDVLRFLPQFLPQLKLDYAKLQNAENAAENQVPSFLLNLNEKAAAGKLDPVIGRTKEIRAVMEILGRRNKNNPVLVGPAGVGKTAIVEGLADAIVKGQVPDVLQGKVIYALDLGQLMAGTKYRGEFEERMQSLLKFVTSKNGEAIIFIDEIHQLVGAGRTDGAMDAANLLKPALARGELHCIGATTPDEFQNYILGDAALERRFRQVMVNEPDVEDAIEILMGIRDKLEIHHGIQIAD
ncbi:MAG: ATP-dependent Clp protease ATP-binding subunit, partial [Bacteriovoracaceae bacterium]|nr:ATP-dependent Clp protease ATP-binding subunit [Bacteriovoracaceae bacterium]